MNTIKTIISLAAFLLVSGCGGAGDQATVPLAEPAEASSANIGGHDVHFSAQSTDRLPTEVARAYNIVRSPNRAMLNVSIIESATGTAVSGVVTVKTVNLTGQLKNVVMRKIEEQEAIYYIGETAVANRETLVFDISVTPEGVDEASDIRFKRQFYTK